jgi:hypothetical protein
MAVLSSPEVTPAWAGPMWAMAVVVATTKPAPSPAVASSRPGSSSTSTTASASRRPSSKVPTAARVNPTAAIGRGPRWLRAWAARWLPAMVASAAGRETSPVSRAVEPCSRCRYNEDRK